MSTQKVTLNDLIAEWKDLTTQSSETRWDEMQAFFARAEEEGITPPELVRRKNDIIRIWCPLTWQEAQKLHDNWKEKSWYDKMKKGTLRTWDKWYCEYARRYKASAQEAPKPQQRRQSSAPQIQRPALKVVGSGFSRASEAEDEYYSQFEVFTTHQQVLDHTKEHEKKLKEKHGK